MRGLHLGQSEATALENTCTLVCLEEQLIEKDMKSSNSVEECFGENKEIKERK